MAVILDIRTKKEFLDGHVCGAINIETPYPPLENNELKLLKQRLSSMNLNKNTKIKVYCKKGIRSSIATRILIDLGYKNVEDLGSFKTIKGYDFCSSHVKRIYCTDDVKKQIKPYMNAVSKNIGEQLVFAKNKDTAHASIEFFTGETHLLCNVIEILEEQRKYCSRFNFARGKEVFLNKVSWDCMVPSKKYRLYALEHELRHALYNAPHTKTGIMRQQSGDVSIFDYKKGCK